jgi:Flp pilus assembly CpaF family ATPase
LATALLGATPSGDRIITIEETAELFPTAHYLEKLIIPRRHSEITSPLSLAELAIQQGPKWIAYGGLKIGHARALLRVLESGIPCVATICSNSAAGALQIFRDNLTHEMPVAFNNEINSRLLNGFQIIAVMDNHDGRPFLKALYETAPTSDSLKVHEILSFSGEQDGKRTWRLSSPSGFWLQKLRDRGHELRIGAGLLPAAE